MIHHVRTSLYTCGLTVAVLLGTGCSGDKGPRRYHVQGRVEFRGAPVPTGRIVFDPDPVKGNRGPQGVAIIQDGAFDTRAATGKGTVGGPHIVRIDGFDGQGGNDDSPFGNALFRDYQQSVDLPQEDTEMDFTVQPTRE